MSYSLSVCFWSNAHLPPTALDVNLVLKTLLFETQTTYDAQPPLAELNSIAALNGAEIRKSLSVIIFACMGATALACQIAKLFSI